MVAMYSTPRSPDSDLLRIFLVEDAAAIRQRLIVLLERCEGVALVGTAASVADATTAILAVRPDALVLDLRITGGSGLQVLRSVRPALPGMRVAVMTNFATEQYRKASLAAGADAFLDKSMEFDRIPALVARWRADWLRQKIC